MGSVVELGGKDIGVFFSSWFGPRVSPAVASPDIAWVVSPKGNGGFSKFSTFIFQ